MSEKKRFTINCCKECPAITSEVHGYFFCIKTNSIINDPEKINKKCPFLVKKKYYRGNYFKLESNPDTQKAYLKVLQDREQHIKSILKKHGYTQSKLAKEIGVSQQMVSKVIKGKSLSKRIENKICSALSVEWCEMFKDEVMLELENQKIFQELRKEIQLFFTRD